MSEEEEKKKHYLIESFKELWYSTDYNLRGGYVKFFILMLTVIPSAILLSQSYIFCIDNFCSAEKLANFKNIVTLFSLYIFCMIVIILGSVVRFFMTGYTKPPQPAPHKKIEEKEEDDKDDDLKYKPFSEYQKRMQRYW